VTHPIARVARIAEEAPLAHEDEPADSICARTWRDASAWSVCRSSVLFSSSGVRTRTRISPWTERQTHGVVHRVHVAPARLDAPVRGAHEHEIELPRLFGSGEVTTRSTRRALAFAGRFRRATHSPAVRAFLVKAGSFWANTTPVGPTLRASNSVVYPVPLSSSATLAPVARRGT